MPSNREKRAARRAALDSPSPFGAPEQVNSFAALGSAPEPVQTPAGAAPAASSSPSSPAPGLSLDADTLAALLPLLHMYKGPQVIPFVPFKFEPSFGGNSSERALAYLAMLDRHYEANKSFFPDGEDDPRRVDQAQRCLTGAAASWFTSLVTNESPVLHSYLLFAEAFRSAFALAAPHVDYFERLRSLSMVGDDFEAYANAFNATVVLLPPSLACPFVTSVLVSQFRAGLPPYLREKLNDVRVHTCGGSAEWTSLSLAQSSAANLVRRRAVVASVAGVSGSAVTVARAEVKGKEKLSAREAEEKGGCRYCRELDHQVGNCKELAAKEGGGQVKAGKD